MNVLIINQYAENKGDRAVLFALVSELLRHTSNITVSTSNPKLWDGYEFYAQNNVRFVPWGWDYNIGCGNLKRKLNIIKKYTYTINRELFLLKGLSSRWTSRLLANPLFAQALNEAELIVSTGGHHVTTILARDAISSQIFDLSFAARMKKNFILWSQTIGPFNFHNDRNYRFVTKIIKQAERIYIRDNHSFSLVNDIVPTISLSMCSFCNQI